MERGIKINTHPGELIYEDIIKENNLTVSKVATMLNVTRATLSNVLNGKAGISSNMALRLEKVFGGNALFWVRMQAAYDLREAKNNFEKNMVSLKPFKFLNAQYIHQ